MTACVTGATSGIGLAIARKFAQQGYDLIITGRRKDRLDSLKQELESTHRISIHTLVFDVRNSNDTFDAFSSLPDSFQQIDILINNAGLAAGLNPIQSGNLEDWEQMIDTNIKGLLYVTKAVLPNMVNRNAGHIINIGSTAGKETYPGGNVYSASKHGVDALSRSMRIDLLPHHIKVTNIAPGLVETEFSLVRFKWDEEKAKNVYAGFDPLTGEDIADCVWFAASRPAHVNIGDMLILPSAQANSTTVNRKP